MTPPFTVKEAAVFLNTTRQQIRKMIHSGELTAIKIGREFRIPQESIEHLLKKTSAEQVQFSSQS